MPTVLANRVQINQVLQNLIINAIKFSGPNRPQIHIDAEKQDTHWIISVQDNGIGIEPGFTDRVFQVFQRLHTREEYPGAGIGLSICKKIVERHGGQIWVEPSPDQGSTFKFTLQVPKDNA